MDMNETRDDGNTQADSAESSEDRFDGNDYQTADVDGGLNAVTGDNLHGMDDNSNSEQGFGSEVDIKEEPNDASQVWEYVDGVYTCQKCGEEFELESRLRAHLMLHSERKVYRCHFCEKLFSKSSNLTSHVRIHTGEKPYRCKICLKTFAWLNGLRTHLPSIHKVEKELLGEFIEKIDSSEAGDFDLTKPVEIKDNIGDLQSNKDEKISLKIKDTDQGNIENFLGSKGKTKLKFDIQETENYFIKTPVVKMTSKSDDDIVNLFDKRKTTYICKYCSKEVSQKSNMTDHVRSHLGVKPFKCKLCGKALSRKQNIVHHLKYIHFIDNCRINDMIIRNDEMAPSNGSTDKVNVEQGSQESEEISMNLGIGKEYQSNYLTLDVNVLGCKASVDPDKSYRSPEILSADTKIDSDQYKSSINEGLQCMESNLQAVNTDLNNVMTNNIQVDETDGNECHYEVIEGEEHGEKKYLCKICGFTCERRYYMTTQHIMKHTGEKRYRCVICCKTYTRRFVFRKHIIKEHSIEEEELESIFCASEISNKKKISSGSTQSTRTMQKSQGIVMESSGSPFEDDPMDVNEPDENPNENTQRAKRKFEELGDPESESEGIPDSASTSDTSCEAKTCVGREETITKGTEAREEEEEFSFTTVQVDGPNKFIFKCNLCDFVCTRKYYMENMHYFKHCTDGKPFYVCVVCCKFYSRRYVLKNHLMKEHDIKGDELEEVLKTTGKRLQSTDRLPQAVPNIANIEMDLSGGRESYFRSKRGELCTVSLESAVQTLKRLSVPSKKSVAVKSEKERMEPYLECKGKSQNLLTKGPDSEENEKYATTDNEEQKLDDNDELVSKNVTTDQVHAQSTFSLENKGFSAPDTGLGSENDSNSEQKVKRCQASTFSKSEQPKESPSNTTNDRAKGANEMNSKKARKVDHPYDAMMKPFMDMKTLTCLKCNKKCSKKSNLKQHIRILHFNLKEYMCQECNKTFNTKFNLKVHMKQHLNPEDRDSLNHDCYICGKGFTTKSYVKVHMSRYHGVDMKV